MNKINVFKNETETVMFKIKDIDYEFNYDCFEKLIDIILVEDDYELESDVELEEYKKLLEGIIEGVKTDDFKNAVSIAEKSKIDLESAEKTEEVI